jgi:hypothetical protein
LLEEKETSREYVEEPKVKKQALFVTVKVVHASRKQSAGTLG